MEPQPPPLLQPQLDRPPPLSEHERIEREERLAQRLAEILAPLIVEELGPRLTEAVASIAAALVSSTETEQQP